MHKEKTFDIGANLGRPEAEHALGMANMDCLHDAHELSLSGMVEIKVLKRQFVSGIESVTIQLRSRHCQSDEPFSKRQ